MSPERETKSVSAETTFDETSRLEELRPILLRLARGSRAAEGGGPRRVQRHLKLKDAISGCARARPSSLPPTQLPACFSARRSRILQAESDGTAFRLIGVGAGDLAMPPRPTAATSPTPRWCASKARGGDRRLREKFGGAAGQRGLAFRAHRHLGGARNHLRRPTWTRSCSPDRLRRDPLELGDVALRRELAVIELQGPADAVLVELEGDRVNRVCSPRPG